MLDQYFVAELFMFFLAAFDSSAKTICNTLYELALNHTIQNKLREEIRNTCIKCNGEITFDDINMMFYLDAVCKGNSFIIINFKIIEINDTYDKI